MRFNPKPALNRPARGLRALFLAGAAPPHCCSASPARGDGSRASGLPAANRRSEPD